MIPVVASFGPGDFLIVVFFLVATILEALFKRAARKRKQGSQPAPPHRRMQWKRPVTRTRRPKPTKQRRRGPARAPVGPPHPMARTHSAHPVGPPHPMQRAGRPGSPPAERPAPTEMHRESGPGAARQAMREATRASDTAHRDLLARAAALQAEVDEALERAEQQWARAKRMGLEHLAEVLLPSSLSRKLRAAAALLTRPEETVHASGRVRELLGRWRMRTEALEALLRQRRRPEFGLALRVVEDALAEPWEALRAMARRRDLARPAGRPVAVATQEGPLLHVLSAAGLQPVPLGADLLLHPERWPLAGAWLARSMLRTFEGLDGERVATWREAWSRSATGAHALETRLIRVVIEQMVDALWEATVATLALGPTWGGAILFDARRLGLPHRHLGVRVDAAGTLRSSPPPHPLIVASRATSGLLGHGSAEVALGDAWLAWLNERGVDPEVFVVEIDGQGEVPIETALFDDVLAEAVTLWLTREWESLGGATLRSLHGAVWGVADEATAWQVEQAIAQGQRIPPRAEGRHVLAGIARFAQSHEGVELASLATLLTGPGSHAVSTPAVAATRREDWRAAVVLREILLPPRALRGRRPPRRFAP